ncbi:MAG TPA: alpha/beta hydrolase [Acidimicrobiales bacterium]|nr:alpha/beta hydrolase [Acidimicrobiales bacterium]
MAKDMTEIAVGPYTFDALVAGPEGGELVLLLHGFPQTSASWREQITALGAAGYRAVAPDQRGYSPRARPIELAAYAMPELVGDVIGFADALGAERFHLVGHDWGGAVAWQVAGRHPDRLHTLAVVSTPHPEALRRAYRGDLGGDQAQRSGYMTFFRQPDSQDRMLENDAAVFRLLFAGSGMPEGREQPYIEALGTPQALGAALNWYRAASVDDPDGLGPITTPTLYVWSTDDVALGTEAAQATAQCVEGPYRFAVLEGVSHWIAEQAPDRLNRLLLDHISSFGAFSAVL